jgi:ATP adenylyltransferase
VETKFTPWRLNYIKRDEGAAEGGCVFCAIGEATPDHDAENLLLLRGQRCFVVLNRFPYNAAHLMVLPFAHTADLVGLDEATAAELFTLTRRAVAVLSAEYQPHGFNMGMNLGRTAGAGIAEHLHMHIVPRWQGDTNFMPVVGGTKLIPEDLPATYERLRPVFERV